MSNDHAFGSIHYSTANTHIPLTGKAHEIFDVFNNSNFSFPYNASRAPETTPPINYTLNLNRSRVTHNLTKLFNLEAAAKLRGTTNEKLRLGNTHHIKPPSFNVHGQTAVDGQAPKLPPMQRHTAEKQISNSKKD